MPEMEEFDIRKWFCSVELEQAEDTYRVVEGILQARREAQPVVKPQRKRRSDAGTKRQSDAERFDREVEKINERIVDTVQHQD